MNVETGTKGNESSDGPEVAQKLKNLLDEGLLTKKEYNAKRKEILEQL